MGWYSEKVAQELRDYRDNSDDDYEFHTFSHVSKELDEYQLTTNIEGD